MSDPQVQAAEQGAPAEQAAAQQQTGAQPAQQPAGQGAADGQEPDLSDPQAQVAEQAQPSPAEQVVAEQQQQQQAPGAAASAPQQPQPAVPQAAADPAPLPWAPVLSPMQLKRGLSSYGSGQRIERLVAKLMSGQPITAVGACLHWLRHAAAGQCSSACNVPCSPLDCAPCCACLSAARRPACCPRCAAQVTIGGSVTWGAGATNRTATSFPARCAAWGTRGRGALAVRPRAEPRLGACSATPQNQLYSLHTFCWHSPAGSSSSSAPPSPTSERRQRLGWLELRKPQQACCAAAAAWLSAPFCRHPAFRCLFSLPPHRDHVLANKAISATNAGTFATCTERLVPQASRAAAAAWGAAAGGAWGVGCAAGRAGVRRSGCWAQ